MTFINYAAREINCKLVYYGPGLCGKTTNLQYIYKKVDPGTKGKLISLATEAERTLFFDFLPLELGTVRGFKTRFHLYTVPGQIFYEASRKLILKGADGVAFVADSQIDRVEANIQSLADMNQHLREQGIDPERISLVMQYDKRDLAKEVPVYELQKALNSRNLLWIEAIAPEGQGVFETLKALAKLVLQELQRKT